MSWNMLVYTIPAFSTLKTLSVFNPESYRQYAEAPESHFSSDIKKVAIRVLHAELQKGAAYREKVQELIGELPSTVKEKTVDGLVKSCMKVVAMPHPLFPIHATTADWDGRFFIALRPDLDQATKEALPWIAAHEIGHVLEQDGAKIQLAKTVASLAMAVLSTFVFGWTLGFAVCATIATNIVIHIVLSRRAEMRADQFANGHCSAGEREKAIVWLEHDKQIGSQGRYIGKILQACLYPSNEARMIGIQNTLKLTPNPKTA